MGCKEEDESSLNYGGWLKASPWKRSNSEDDQRRTVDSSSCARGLFVTKPKQVVTREIKKSGP